MPTYKKAPNWRGKDLTLNIGRADMRVLDWATYTDPRLAKFVGMGFLVEIKEPSAKAAQVVRAPVPVPTPVPVPPVVAQEPPVPAQETLAPALGPTDTVNTKKARVRSRRGSDE